MSDLIEEQHTDLGAGHFMDSNVTLHSNGHIDATTRTQTVTWFGGFHGGVLLIFYDANGTAIGNSNEHTFGVDGRMIGRSDRTDYWGEDIDPGLATRTARFDILHFWDPQYSAIINIVQHAVQVGQTAEPLLDELKRLGLIP